MFPSQTSMIPVHIALARFLEQGADVFSNYPYWYLGTTPFRYLTGPILPWLLVALHKIFPQFNLFEIMFAVIGVFWALGAVGVYKLVKVFANSSNRSLACLSAFFYLLGPIVPFLFSFSDGLHLISFSLIPWVLWTYAGLLGGRPHRIAPTIGLITFVIFLDTSIIPSMILGVTAVLLSVSKWKGIEKRIKKVLLIIFCSLLITTIWYTPGYWFRLLFAPSFAGKPLISVVGQIGQLLPLALAIVLAIISSKFIKHKPPITNHQSPIIKFSFYFLFLFGFLTLMRFISDPDFWMDWSAYGLEIQLGTALCLGLIMNGKLLKNQKSKIKNQKYRLKIKNLLILLCSFTLYSLLFTFMLKKYTFDSLQQDITHAVEYQIGNELEKLVKPGERVFLSGSTVFWLNSFFDISQVRGGVDRASVNSDWRKAAWEIREGSDAKGAREWLETLNASWLVVHNQSSEEYYHDFKYPEKFEELGELKKIYDKNGDRIYRISNQ